MPSAASVILNRAKASLNDPDNTQWTEDELIEYLNDAQSQVVMMRPEANSATVVQVLVAGTKQTIPADSYALVDVIRNMGTNGTTPGRVIRKASFYHIDKNYPDWHTETANAVVKNYLYDTRNRKTFYVRPQQPSSPSQVEMVVSKVPSKIAAAATPLSLEEVYEPALLAYVLYRAFLKDVAVDDEMMAKANGFYGQFERSLMGKGEADGRTHPGNQLQTAQQERGY